MSKERQESIEKEIQLILDKKDSGVDCSESDSAELKGFIRSHLSFIQHFGEDHSSVEIRKLFNRVTELFPQEFSEVLDEEGL